MGINTNKTWGQYPPHLLWFGAEQQIRVRGGSRTRKLLAVCFYSKWRFSYTWDIKFICYEIYLLRNLFATKFICYEIYLLRNLFATKFICYEIYLLRDLFATKFFTKFSLRNFHYEFKKNNQWRFSYTQTTSSVFL